MVARSALVVGADHPLGAAAAVALAALGVGVLIVGENERALGEVVGEIAYSGGRARHRVAVSPVDVPALAAEASQLFGEPCEIVGVGDFADERCSTILRSIESREAPHDTTPSAQRRIYVIGEADPAALLEIFRAAPAVHILA